MQYYGNLNVINKYSRQIVKLCTIKWGTIGIIFNNNGIKKTSALSSTKLRKKQVKYMQ